MDLQAKLNNVASPSSSKDGEEEDYDPDIDEDHLGEDCISSNPRTPRYWNS